MIQVWGIFFLFFWKLKKKRGSTIARCNSFFFFLPSPPPIFFSPFFVFSLSLFFVSFFFCFCSFDARKWHELLCMAMKLSPASLNYFIARSVFSFSFDCWLVERPRSGGRSSCLGKAVWRWRSEMKSSCGGRQMGWRKGAIPSILWGTKKKKKWRLTHPVDDGGAVTRFSLLLLKKKKERCSTWD